MPLKGSSLLLLEDEPLLRRRLSRQLDALGLELTAVSTIAEARNALGSLDFDFALFDVNLPDGTSMSLLNEHLVPKSCACIIMTAEGAIEGAVEAMRLGAADYLVKPFELSDLSPRLLRARGTLKSRRGEQFRREQDAARGPDFVFGKSLAPLRATADKIIAADRRLREASLPPILIEGETGTGKTSLARWIHRHGPRAEGPWVEVNCSALPETLAESELFGHERGAFTDAREARLGLLEAAEGGTLFLDELPSLSLATQARLLKAIEDHSIRRVGGNRAIPVDVRIIAATNSDLKKLCAEGRFREDLLHRLDLFRLNIPPLRERGEDILALAGALAAGIARNYGLPPQEIPPAGRERLLAYRWPGNVRELAHEIERSLVFEDDKLHFSALVHGGGEASLLPGAGFQFPAEGFSLEQTIDRYVHSALAQAEGNVSAAARLLGVTRDYVRYRQKGYEENKS